MPKDSSKPSFIVFASNHFPWYHVGADIKAWFKKGGNVYIGRNNALPPKVLLSSYSRLQKGNIYIANNSDLSSNLMVLEI